MTPVLDLAARRGCAIPRAPSPAWMRVIEPRLPAAGRSGTNGRDKFPHGFTRLRQAGSGLPFNAAVNIIILILLDKCFFVPPSFRRKPESSNSDHPFPLCGSDNKHAPAARPQTAETAKLPGIRARPCWIPASAGMTKWQGSHAFARAWHRQAILIQAKFPRDARTRRPGISSPASGRRAASARRGQVWKEGRDKSRKD